MKFYATLLIAAASVATAQVSYDNSTETWHCPIANGSYCAGDSLSGSTIILCTNGVGYVGNCDGHVQDRPPIDVYTAQCWQQSPTAGNATCSKNCTVWPDYGNPYPVPGSCSFSAASNGSDVAGYGFDGGNSTSSNSTGPYHNSTITSTASLPTGTSPTHSGSGAASTTTSAAPISTGGAAANAISSVLGVAAMALAVYAL